MSTKVFLSAESFTENFAFVSGNIKATYFLPL
jgi:hypothetical protein